MKVLIQKEKWCVTPTRATKGSSGYDIYLSKINSELIKNQDGMISFHKPINNMDYEELIIEPNARLLIKTGIKVGIPEGYEIQIRSRSGLSLKQGLTVINSPGTIDSDYRGEIGVILINNSNQTQILELNTRIAQMVLQKVEEIDFEDSDDIPDTLRGDGGYGSTDKISLPFSNEITTDKNHNITFTTTSTNDISDVIIDSEFFENIEKKEIEMEFTIEQEKAIIKAAEDNNIATDIVVRIGDEETSIKREIKAIFIELVETIHYDSEFFEQTKVKIDNKTYSFLQSRRFCKKCGKPFHLNDSEKGTDITNIMVENTYCFECSFWKQTKDVYLDKGKSIIIKECDKLCHYVDGGVVEPENILKGLNKLGHGGRHFHIDKFDDGTIISTNNLWCQGYIPEIWKTEFKENAQHIKI